MSFTSPQITFESQQHFCFPSSQPHEHNISYHHEKENVQNDVTWFYTKTSFEEKDDDQYKGLAVEPSPKNSQLLEPPKPARTAMMCFSLSKSKQDDADGSKVSITVSS